MWQNQSRTCNKEKSYEARSCKCKLANENARISQPNEKKIVLQIIAQFSEYHKVEKRLVEQRNGKAMVRLPRMKLNKRSKATSSPIKRSLFN
jgi:hypothetical protein